MVWLKRLSQGYSRPSAPLLFFGQSAIPTSFFVRSSTTTSVELHTYLTYYTKQSCSGNGKRRAPISPKAARGTHQPEKRSYSHHSFTLGHTNLATWPLIVFKAGRLDLGCRSWALGCLRWAGQGKRQHNFLADALT